MHCLFYGPLLLSLSLSANLAGQEALQTHCQPPFQCACAQCHTLRSLKKERGPAKHKRRVIITACNLKEFSIMNTSMLSSLVAWVPWLGKGVKPTDHNTDSYNGHWWCLIQIPFSRPVYLFPKCQEWTLLRVHSYPFSRELLLAK